MYLHRELSLRTFLVGRLAAFCCLGLLADGAGTVQDLTCELVAELNTPKDFAEAILGREKTLINALKRVGFVAVRCLVCN